MAYNSCASVLFNSFDGKCDKSIGGIKRILICPQTDILGISYGYQTITDVDSPIIASNTIRNIVCAEGKKFEQFLFKPNTSSYTSTFSGDKTIGSQVVTTEVTLQFSRAEYQKRLEFQKLIGQPCVVLVEDMYGKFIVLGVDNPVYCTNSVMQSGTAKADLSGFTLTLTEEGDVLPPFLDNDFILSDILTAHTFKDFEYSWLCDFNHIQVEDLTQGDEVVTSVTITDVENVIFSLRAQNQDCLVPIKALLDGKYNIDSNFNKTYTFVVSEPLKLEGDYFVFQITTQSEEGMESASTEYTVHGALIAKVIFYGAPNKCKLILKTFAE